MWVCRVENGQFQRVRLRILLGVFSLFLRRSNYGGLTPLGVFVDFDERICSFAEVLVVHNFLPTVQLWLNFVSHCNTLLPRSRGFSPRLHFVFENVAGQRFGAVLLFQEGFGGVLDLGDSLRLLGLAVRKFGGLSREPPNGAGDQSSNGSCILSTFLRTFGYDFVFFTQNLLAL